jgi:hypothetical protein
MKRECASGCDEWRAWRPARGGYLLEPLFSFAARLRALSARDCRVLLAASILLPLFWLGLRVFGLARFHALVVRRELGIADLSPSDVRRHAQRVNAAARYSPFPATCLSRSLLLAWLLRRHGVATALRIGVRFTEVGLDAHAWLEWDGIPINDSLAMTQKFAPFNQPVPTAAYRDS